MKRLFLHEYKCKRLVDKLAEKAMDNSRQNDDAWRRRYENLWSNFLIEYNASFLTIDDMYCLQFKDEERYTMFILQHGEKDD